MLEMLKAGAENVAAVVNAKATVLGLKLSGHTREGLEKEFSRQLFAGEIDAAEYTANIEFLDRFW